MATTLGQVAMDCVTRGAIGYLEEHDLIADPQTLLEFCVSWCKSQMPKALKDAKDALDANMPQIAEQTFAASMVLAGVEAAKEAGFPRGMKA